MEAPVADRRISCRVIVREAHASGDIVVACLGVGPRSNASI
jgi:hypothetical protein